MDADEGRRRSEAKGAWVASTVAAVLMGLAIGTVAGLRLADSTTVVASRPVAGEPAPAIPGRAEAASRRAEHIDHSAMATRSSDAPTEAGTSIAAYGD